MANTPNLQGLEQHLIDNHGGKRQGKEIKLPCPFCGDINPSAKPANYNTESKEFNCGTCEHTGSYRGLAGQVSFNLNKISNDSRGTHLFLSALAGDKNITFQAFDDSENKNPELSQYFHGTLEEHGETLTALNKAGAGIFLMVNEGDLKGRAKKNVVRVRALFADFDDVPLPDKWPLEPSIIVESSHGKYHAYWLLADTLPLDDFKPLQKTIAEFFGSDSKVCDLPRVMRLPNLYHQKYEPFLTQLIKCDGDIKYAASQLKEVFPVKEVEIPTAKPNHKVTFNSDTSDNSGKYAQKALENEYNNVVNAGKGNRNHTLNTASYSLGQLVGSGLLNESDIENTLLNAAIACGLSENEAKTTIKSGFSAGILEPRYPQPLENDGEYSRGKMPSSITGSESSSEIKEEQWGEIVELPEDRLPAPLLDVELIPLPISYRLPISS